MTRKRSEGSEEQKRQTAREAQRAGGRPSEVGSTTGASKQRHHVKRKASHEERFETKAEGKVAAGGEGQRKMRPHSRP